MDVGHGSTISVITPPTKTLQLSLIDLDVTVDESGTGLPTALGGEPRVGRQSDAKRFRRGILAKMARESRAARSSRKLLVMLLMPNLCSSPADLPRRKTLGPSVLGRDDLRACGGWLWLAVLHHLARRLGHKIAFAIAASGTAARAG